MSRCGNDNIEDECLICYKSNVTMRKALILRGWANEILIAFLFDYCVFLWDSHTESAIIHSSSAFSRCSCMSHVHHPFMRLHSIHCNNSAFFSSAHSFSVITSLNGVWVSRLFTLLLLYGFAFMFFLCCWLSGHFHDLVELHLTSGNEGPRWCPTGVSGSVPRP